MKRIIIHADDFGLHPAVNAGIEEAHRFGIVTSASIMPLGSAFDDAVTRSQALPTLDIGLHFALTGVPGAPPSLSSFFLLSLSGRLRSADIYGSLRRQLDICLAHGLPLTHIDSHQHLHALPSIMQIVCKAAQEYGIRNVRLPLDGPSYAPVPIRRRAQAAALSAAARLSHRILDDSGLHTTERFCGMAISGHLTAPTLADYIRHARIGTAEIVCHPGTNNLQLAHSYPWGYDWQGELAALCAPDVQQIARDEKTHLIGWGLLDS